MGKQQRILSLYFLLAATVVVNAAPVWSADSTLLVAGVELRLGMPQQAVLDAVKRNYELVEVDQKRWLIRTRQGPPYQFLGGLSFRDGHLAEASKDWGSFSERGAFEFARELSSILEALTREVGTVAQVTVAPMVRQPGLRSDQIEFRFPGKKVIILITEGQDRWGKQVSLQETLMP